MHIWSIRAFTATELAAMLGLAGDSLPARLMNESWRRGPVFWQHLPTEVGSIVNSGFPYGFNDGPLWAGRGLTAYVSGGIRAQAGVFSAAINPMMFIAQNARFDLPVPGAFSLSTPYAESIDLPVRFGDRSYGRLDPGESEFRFQTRHVAAGVSTASQVWGPADDHPLILGNNAGGFPHAFVETAEPLNLYVAALHTRFIWGRLDGSAFGPPDKDDRRFVTAAVSAFTFPLLPGLEVGAARFFHAPWPDDLLRAPIFSVFQGILKSSIATRSNPSGDVPGDNQIASIFFRWAMPPSGVEVYGEYGREDHNANIRDFWEEIDHDAAFMLGLQRAWGGGIRTNVFRLEHANTRMGKLHPTRIQAPWYIHSVRVQGHTQRGQLLATPGGFGGGGTSIVWDRYERSSRTTLRWDRLMRAEELDPFENSPITGGADVMHAIGANRSWDIGRGAVDLGVAAVIDLNRDFRRDAFNLNTRFGYKFLW